MNAQLTNWAIRHSLTMQALNELRTIFNLSPEQNPLTYNDHKTEAYVQSVVRLEAAKVNVRLWRNNVGVLLDKDGRPVRYGLANDSPKLNSVIKSGDLIGWRPVFITDAMVGSTIAQFVSRECKRPGWMYSGGEREEAQLKWAEIVNAGGGDAKFVTGEGTL